MEDLQIKIIGCTQFNENIETTSWTDTICIYLLWDSEGVLNNSKPIACSALCMLNSYERRNLHNL